MYNHLSNHIQLYTTIPHTITSPSHPSSFILYLSFFLQSHTIIIPSRITYNHSTYNHRIALHTISSLRFYSLSLSSLITHWGTIISNHIQSSPIISSPIGPHISPSHPSFVILSPSLFLQLHTI